MRNIVIAILCIARPAFAEQNATLPLEEVLRLYRAEDAAKSAAEDRPPRSAALSKIDMVGRLYDGAVEITAQIEVSVLDDGWTSVRLFPKDASVSKLPTIAGATFAVVNDGIALVAAKAGIYRGEIVFRKRASGRPQQHVELDFPDAAAATLVLHYDETVFHLLSHGGDAASDGIYPVAGRFVIDWERTAAPTRHERAPVESALTAAHASVVSTLAGRIMTRVAYDLRLEGVRPIDFTLAPGDALERVYVNGAPIVAKVEKNQLRIDVSPARSGDNSAKVELVTSRDHGSYLLSGMLDFTFPSASWPCHDLFVTLSLPQAFNYTWVGGSMAPADTVPDATFSYTMPTPGKPVRLHQQWVEHAPNVRVRYSVDLAGSYFH